MAGVINKKLTMSEDKEKNKEEQKRITKRSENYSQWYLDVVSAAELAENAPVRGCMVIKPDGYALWEKIQGLLDKKFKETGVRNVYFPLFIPEKFLKKEGEHVEGFSPEVAAVTHAGGKKLEEPLIVRPTSETIMYDSFSRWISSYRDLPLLVNQWANVVRWELRPRLFLRTTEFLWQEGHTVHETKEGADERARQMLDVYRYVAEEIMAIPVISGMKSEAEKFAGALYTYTLEAMMQDGKALQFATSHNLGNNFAKAFDVSFLGRKGEKEYGWQTSWGLSTRTIGGLIMAHSDDKGLVLPPRVAPKQVVITTIPYNEGMDEVYDKAKELADELKTDGFSIEVDDRNIHAGEKFYYWERKGVPLRIEIGPKDVQEEKAVLVRRDTGEKKEVSLSKVLEETKTLLDDIQSSLYRKASQRLKEKTKEVDAWDDFVKEIKEDNFVLAHWCGEREIEEKIQEETGATIRCIPFDSPEEEGKCVKTGKPSKKRVVFGKAY